MRLTSPRGARQVNLAVRALRAYLKKQELTSKQLIADEEVVQLMITCVPPHGPPAPLVPQAADLPQLARKPQAKVAGGLGW